MEYYSAIKRNGVSVHVITWINLPGILLSEKKPVLKGYILYDYLYNTIEMTRNIAMGNRLGGARGEGMGQMEGECGCRGRTLLVIVQFWSCRWIREPTHAIKLHTTKYTDTYKQMFTSKAGEIWARSTVRSSVNTLIVILYYSLTRCYPFGKLD